MPVEYSGIIDEHMAVRTRAGLFDVSHMGEIEIAGTDALAAVQRITSQRRVEAAGRPGAVLRPDDAAGHVRGRPARLPAGARRTSCSSSTPSNIAKDFALDRRARSQAAGDAVAVNASSRYALLALQGPAAREVLQPLTGVDLGGHEVLLVRDTARWPASARTDLAHRLHRRGRLRDLRAAAVGRARLATRCSRRARPPASIPCGLGARDTLRLEAAMRLYGNDIDDTTTVARSGPRLDRRLEEGRLHRPRRAARSRRPNGVARKLVGFEMIDRAHRAPRLRRRTSTAQQVGVVTSGTQTPFLKKAIGMAYLPRERTRAGHRVRGRHPRPPRRARASCRCRSTSAPKQ